MTKTEARAVLITMGIVVLSIGFLYGIITYYWFLEAVAVIIIIPIITAFVVAVILGIYATVHDWLIDKKKKHDTT